MVIGSNIIAGIDYYFSHANSAVVPAKTSPDAGVLTTAPA
jgi:hypothetical protein